MKDAVDIARAFLSAFEQGDLQRIDNLLAPNFHDIRAGRIELSRFEYLNALDVFFRERSECEFIIHHLVSTGPAVAVEITITMAVAGERLKIHRHDLLLIEDGLIEAIHEYGDDGGEGAYASDTNESA